MLLFPASCCGAHDNGSCRLAITAIECPGREFVMREQGLYSRSFLTSLTGSLVIHLIMLIVILLPSNHFAKSADQGQVDASSSSFSPTLLINYSNDQLKRGLSNLAEAGSQFDELQKKGTWNKADFADTVQSQMKKLGTTVTSVSLPQSQLDVSLLSVRMNVVSDSKKVLRDFLFVGYITGIGTKLSNFRSDDLVITFTEDSGAVINVRIPTNDCRLFAAGKLTGAQFIQNAKLS
jgi:hypothetical protein